MSSTIPEVPPLLPMVCSNEDVEVIELFMVLSELIEMCCPMSMNDIQQHQAGDTWLLQT